MLPLSHDTSIIISIFHIFVWFISDFHICILTILNGHIHLRCTWQDESLAVNTACVLCILAASPWLHCSKHTTTYQHAQMRC